MTTHRDLTINKINYLNLLEERVKQILKHYNNDFTAITAKQLCGNINMVFSTNYTEEDVNTILGWLYEERFFYENMERKEGG